MDGKILLQVILFDYVNRNALVRSADHTVGGTDCIANVLGIPVTGQSSTQNGALSDLREQLYQLLLAELADPSTTKSRTPPLGDKDPSNIKRGVVRDPAVYFDSGSRSS